MNPRLKAHQSTIFAEMSALAVATKSINLGQGFPDSDGPAEILEAAITAINRGHNQYPPPLGTPELRLAISEHQKRFRNVSYDPNNEILVTAGATEAIAATMLGLCDNGDDIIVFEPSYDSYGAAAAMANAKLKSVPLLAPTDDEPRRYTFDPDALAAAFSANTKLLLLNSPHNPTGKVFSGAELELIAKLCIEHDVIAVTDEVYEHLVFEGEHTSLASLAGMKDRTVSISSAGKTFSVTGWKIGWACAPHGILKSITTAKQYLTFVNGAPFQPAIAQALRLPDSYFVDYRAELERKEVLLNGYLTEAGFKVHRPQGTFFTNVAVESVGYDSDIDFCMRLPELAGVVAVPTSVFYSDQTSSPNLARFCFAKKDANLTEAGERLVAAFAP